MKLWPHHVGKQPPDEYFSQCLCYLNQHTHTHTQTDKRLLHRQLAVSLIAIGIASSSAVALYVLRPVSLSLISWADQNKAREGSLKQEQ